MQVKPGATATSLEAWEKNNRLVPSKLSLPHEKI